MTGVTQESLKEIDILWINAGLSCDGDTVSITGATQPSLEDVVLGIGLCHGSPLDHLKEKMLPVL